MTKNKNKKQEENRRYKEKMKSLRLKNPATNAAHMEKQLKWKKASRERETKRNEELEDKRERGRARQREILEEKTAEARRRASTLDCSRRRINPERTSSRVRKRVQRVLTSLPTSPKGWSETMNYIVDHASPRRKVLFQEANQTKEPISTQSEFMNILDLTKVGRPSKAMGGAKKRLMYGSVGLVGTEAHRRYMKRQKAQNVISKVQKAHSLWDSRLTQFLDRNSRIMPNKRDTILLPDGQRVAKRHLLNTKYQTFQLFMKEMK